jgi:hypothetical protein
LVHQVIGYFTYETSGSGGLSLQKLATMADDWDGRSSGGAVAPPVYEWTAGPPAAALTSFFVFRFATTSFGPNHIFSHQQFSLQRSMRIRSPSGSLAFQFQLVFAAQLGPLTFQFLATVVNVRNICGDTPGAGGAGGLTVICLSV